MRKGGNSIIYDGFHVGSASKKSDVHDDSKKAGYGYYT
jgi:hypothetical protein